MPRTLSQKPHTGATKCEAQCGIGMCDAEQTCERDDSPYIKEHAGSQTKEIAENTQFSPTTVERCLAELRKQELVKYKGSKKMGGYHAVNSHEIPTQTPNS